MPTITPANYATEIEAAIRLRVQTLWVDSEDEPLTPIQWADVPFAPTVDAPWLRVDILHGASVKTAYGGINEGANDIAGSIQLMIFAPKGQGPGAMAALVDQARPIFNRYFGSGLNCGASSGPQINPAPTESPWSARVITTPFTVQEFIAA